MFLFQPTGSGKFESFADSGTSDNQSTKTKHWAQETKSKVLVNVNISFYQPNSYLSFLYNQAQFSTNVPRYCFRKIVQDFDRFPKGFKQIKCTWDSHIERKQVLVLPFKDLKLGVCTCYGVQPQKFHSGSFCDTF